MNEGVFVTGQWSTYCTVDDVLRLLRPYTTATPDSDEVMAAAVSAELPAAKSGIDTEAGRDFGLHSGAEVWADGSGTALLSLADEEYRTPLRSVLSLEVDGEALGEGTYVVYGEQGTVRLVSGEGLERFPRGVQNVRAVVEWGHAAPPSSIRFAQAKLAAAAVLAQSTGEAATMERLRVGDYEVAYGDGGQHAVQIGSWVSEALAAARHFRRVRMVAV